MEVKFEGSDPGQSALDALIVPVASGTNAPAWSALAERLDGSISGALSGLAADARFTGSPASTLVVPTLGLLPARRLVIVGLGKASEVSPASIVRAYGAAARAARDAGAINLAAALPDTGAGIADAASLQAAAVGASIGLYRFEKYRGAAAAKSGAAPDAQSLTFFASLPPEDADAALRRAAAIAGAVALARDLVNEPGSTVNPEYVADRAREVAASSGLEIEVLGPDELAAIGAEAMLAVGSGSASPPRMIRLSYRPRAEPTGERVTGLVGKCITFDTGGYSIKPYEGMLHMKGDMAGGAAVLGAMSALRELNCPVPVEATICAAENMISGTAFRPGDVLRGMNGVTMEILSTDAEGRLVLADGLVDTARRGATELIDLATLTGAKVIALGDDTAALFASDDALAARVTDAATASGERMWRLPLSPELEKQIEGDVADIKNTGGRAGGAITAALFLQHFNEGLPWAHLDIAGANRQDKATALGPKGATGYGVRTLLEYLMNET